MMTLKSRTFLILLAAVLPFCCFLSSCNVGSQAPPPSEPLVDETVADSDANIPQDAVMMFGEPQTFTVMEPDVNIYLRYPVTGITIVDETISNKMMDYYNENFEDFVMVKESYLDSDLEMNFHYNSYLTYDLHFAGIEEIGFISSSYMAHPVTVVDVYNIELSSGTLITTDQILSKGKEDFILRLLKDKLTARFSENIDLIPQPLWDWLRYTVITDYGVKVNLPRGVFLPTFFGDVNLEFTRDELGDALILDSTDLTESSNNELDSAVPSVPDNLNIDVDPAKPMVALTFDDGPSKYTAEIVALLEKYDVHATFFQLGNLMTSYPEAEKAIMDQGSEISSHTWDHRNLTKLSASEIRDELNNTNSTIESISGSKSTLFRPPYGSMNSSVKSIAKELDLIAVLWSVDPEDWRYKNADKVYNNIMSNLKDGDIILCHDIYSSTQKAMERVIPDILAQGYQIVTVSTLLSYTDKSIVAGNAVSRK
jgi:peptidoglycan/xylan/chitin deacetylase (PgdA/CDA1 family)